MSQITAVVILNYNGQHFLEQFLPTVVAHSQPHEVYVADNASTDGSVAWIETHCPTVKRIKLAVNTGYAGGYNLALSQIKADFFVLLNSDVLVTPQWVEPLISVFKDPDVAACQPKIRSFAAPLKFEYAGAAGGYLDWLGYAFCRGRVFDVCEEDHGQYNETTSVFWATGACMAVRAEVFRALDGFDADFFAHYEEIDLCWRMLSAGHQVYYTPDATVYHVGGGTLPSSSPFKTYLNYRNSLAMLYKNLPSSKVFIIIFLRLILDGISSVRFLKEGDWRNIWAIIRAHFAFYGMLPQLYPKRQKIKAMKQFDAATLLFGKSVVWQYFVKKKQGFGSIHKI